MAGGIWVRERTEGHTPGDPVNRGACWPQGSRAAHVLGEAEHPAQRGRARGPMGRTQGPAETKPGGTAMRPDAPGSPKENERAE